jgi:hypothetical protein
MKFSSTAILAFLLTASISTNAQVTAQPASNVNVTKSTVTNSTDSLGNINTISTIENARDSKTTDNVVPNKGDNENKGVMDGEDSKGQLDQVEVYKNAKSGEAKGTSTFTVNESKAAAEKVVDEVTMPAHNSTVADDKDTKQTSAEIVEESVWKEEKVTSVEGDQQNYKGVVEPVEQEVAKTTTNDGDAKPEGGKGEDDMEAKLVTGVEEVEKLAADVKSVGHNTDTVKEATGTVVDEVSGAMTDVSKNGVHEPAKDVGEKPVTDGATDKADESQNEDTKKDTGLDKAGEDNSKPSSNESPQQLAILDIDADLEAIMTDAASDAPSDTPSDVPSNIASDAPSDIATIAPGTDAARPTNDEAMAEEEKASMPNPVIIDNLDSNTINSTTNEKDDKDGKDKENKPESMEVKEDKGAKRLRYLRGELYF